MFDWQTIAVALAVMAAAVYVTWRGLARLRSFRMNRASTCETGCGSCGDEQRLETTGKPALVNIARKP